MLDVAEWRDRLRLQGLGPRGHRADPAQRPPEEQQAGQNQALQNLVQALMGGQQQQQVTKNPFA